MLEAAPLMTPQADKQELWHPSHSGWVRMARLLDPGPGSSTMLCRGYLQSTPSQGGAGPGHGWRKHKRPLAPGPQCQHEGLQGTKYSPESPGESEGGDTALPGGRAVSDERGSSVWEPKRKAVKAEPGQRSRLDRTGGLTSPRSAPAIRPAACVSAKPATDGSLRKQSFWLS